MKQEEERRRLGRMIKNKPLLRAGVFAVLLLTAAGLSFFAGSNEEAPALTETNQTEVQDSQETAVSEIWVHVAGAVAQPGVVKIPEGSRVIEAIEAAGGLLPEADSTNLNFAAQAQDGQKINVAYAGESASEETGSGLININTADEKTLQELPGIGEVTAANIKAYRESNGPFSSKEQIKEVPRIGDKLFAQIEDLICI